MRVCVCVCVRARTCVLGTIRVTWVYNKVIFEFLLLSVIMFVAKVI